MVKLRSISYGRLKIAFLLADPLYLFCASEWNEPDFVVGIQGLTICLQTLLKLRPPASEPPGLSLFANDIDRYQQPVNTDVPATK